MRGAFPVAAPSRGTPGWVVPAVRHAWTFPLVLVFALWVFVLFDPDVWLASQGLLWTRRIPVAAYAMVGALVLVVASPGSRTMWCVPFLLYVVNAMLTVQFAENTGIARGLVLKLLVLYYVLAVGSLAFLKRVDKTKLLLELFLLQFLFWGAQALFGDATKGHINWHPIAWHPILGNTDAFAPLMVIGMGFSYFYGLATSDKVRRWLALVTGSLCVIGMVAAFTRGASLAAGVIVLYCWARTPKTGKAFAGVAIAAAVLLIATSQIYSGGQYWERLGTIVTEGTREGTGRDRWDLWQIGFRVFAERPVFGVGAGNFGMYAFYHLKAAELLGQYALHQGAIWTRSLHNIYMQILVEFGVVGSLAFLGMLIDFWRRNAALRTTPFMAAWKQADPHGLDLRNISLALQAAMVAFLITGFFYDQLYSHWLYSLLILNAVLHGVANRLRIAATATAR